MVYTFAWWEGSPGWGGGTWSSVVTPKGSSWKKMRSRKLLGCSRRSRFITTVILHLKPESAGSRRTGETWRRCARRRRRSRPNGTGVWWTLMEHLIRNEELLLSRKNHKTDFNWEKKRFYTISQAANLMFVVYVTAFITCCHILILI